MRPRTMLSYLLAAVLLAGVISAPPALADDAPPIGTEAPAGDGDADGDLESDGDPNDGSGGGDDSQGDSSDDGMPAGIGPMAFGDLLDAVPTEPLEAIEPHVRTLDFDFAEPQTLYSAGDFPTPIRDEDWDQQFATAEQREVSVNMVVAADLDGDGYDDAVSLVYVRNPPPVGIGLRAPGQAFVTGVAGQVDPALGGWYVVVHLMTPGVGLLAGTPYPVGTESDDFLGAMAVGDVDGDGAPDVVFSKRGEQSVITLINDGDGAFPSSVTTPLDRRLDRGIVLGDLDGDPGLDLIAPVNAVNTVVVLRANGDGTFRPGAELSVPDPANVALIDADGTGAPELLVTSFGASTPASLWRWSDPGAGDWPDGWAEVEGALPTTTTVAAWVGDFDGDSDADAALLLRSCDAAQQGRCLLPLRNDGSGMFTALDPVASTYLTVFATGHLVSAFPAIDGTTADVDGDGHLDIVMPGAIGDVGVAFGDGAGSFPDLRTVAGAAGWEPEDAGGWDAPTEAGGDWPANWGTALRAVSVAALEGTGDGTVDLLVGTASGHYRTYAGTATGRLSLVTGVGAGSRGFAAADAWGISDRQWQADLASAQPVLVDATGDGHDDIVFLQDAGDDTAVMVSRWDDGRFLPATVIGEMPPSCIGWNHGRLVVADVVGDDAVDVVCVDSSKIYLARGSPSGMLGTPSTIGDLSSLTPKGEDIVTLVATDLDGDGDLDIAFSAGTISGQFFDGVAFGWIENLGGATGFAAAQWLQQSGFNYANHSAGSPLKYGPVIADLTGDGLADFAIAAGKKNSQGAYELFVYVNDGASGGQPAFTARDTVTVDLISYSVGAGYLDAGDLDGDGVVDLVLTGIRSIGSGEYGNRMRLLLGTPDGGDAGRGTGDFTPGALFPTGAALPGHRVADLNGDGRADLISPTGYRGVELRAGRADGTLGTPQVFGTPGAETPWVQVTDVDGNGAPDVIGAIAEAGPGVGQLAVLRNLGAGSTDPGGDTDPPCEPGDADCDPGCDPGADDCDDDDGDPPAKTVNLVADTPVWSGAASLDAVTAGTVTVTVGNTGTTATTGTWVDSLWLSADETWSADDTLLAAIPRTAALAAGGTVTTEHAVTLAPPQAGTYHLILRADTRGEVAETRLDGDDATVPAEDDNLGVSAEVVFDPPTLDIPGSGSAPGDPTTVTGPGAVVRIPAIAGGTAAVRLTVTGADVTGFAVRAGKLPSATAADQRITGAGSITLVPGAERYLRVDLGAGQTATVTATRMEFGVGSVTPKRVSVGGSVSFLLTGVGLAQVNAVWAIDPDGHEVPATALVRHSSGDLTATVDLTGQQAGEYDLRVQSASESATLAGAFTAVADRVGSVRTSVLIPSSLRTGTVGEVWVTYANDGLTDAVSPILRISSRGVVPTAGSPYPMGQFYVSPEAAWAPVGIIPAGASGRIVIPFRVDASGPDGLAATTQTSSGNTYGFYVEEFGIDSQAPYHAASDFAEELLALEEDGEANEDERAAIVLELVARLGDTGGSYLVAMHRLRAGMSTPTADMDDLRAKVFDNVKAAVLTDAVHGTLRDAGEAVPNRGLRIEVAGGTGDARTIDVLTDELGHWSVPGLDGVAETTVRVDGYGPGPVETLHNLSSESAVDITLPSWAPLTGVVTGLDGRFAADAVVTVLSADGTQWVRAVTDADGVYRFDGVAPGTHRIAAVGADGGLVTADLTMPATATAKNLPLQDSDLASGGGTVTGALPPMPISGLSSAVPAEVDVWVDDDTGLRTVTADGDGSFAITGTPGVHATLWIFDAFLGVRAASVTYPAAGGTSPVQWSAGGVSVSVPVTLPADDVLPQVYVQRAGSPGAVPMPGIGAGMMLIPSGRAGDPVTWAGGTGAGVTGTLTVANVPPGDYRVTVVYPDGGEDVAEFAVATTNVGVTFPARPATAAASGTAMQGATPIAGGFVELVSRDLTPARRYVTGIGNPEADPPGTAGEWSVTVVAGSYDVTYYDASGALKASEVKTYSAGSPFRGAGRALASGPAAAPAVAGHLLSSSSLVTAPTPTAGEYEPMGGSSAELKAIYLAKFDSGTKPPPDQEIELAKAMPYPKQPPPKECKALDYRWLDAAKAAANKAEATRQLIIQLINDTRKTKAWMIGEAALRGVMFLGEISNFFLGVLAVKEAIGKAAVNAAAREEAKALVAQGLKPPPPTGIIDLSLTKALSEIQTITGLASTIYTNAKAAIYSAEPAGASAVIGMLGELGSQVVALSKELAYLATSTVVTVAREIIGPIAAINNMITQVREAGQSYDSAMQQLDSMKSALDRLYISYDFDLSQAHIAWLDFQANRFPEIKIDGDDCEDGGGGGGDDDDDPDNPGGGDGDGDGGTPPGPEGPKPPHGPKPGPKPAVGPSFGREVAGVDPNEIVGPLGVGEEQWMQAGSVLGYRISFENLGPGTVHPPDGVPLAEVPAATVTVDFPLPDAAVIDSVELGDFGFGVGDGEVRYLPDPGATSYEREDAVSLTVPSVYEGEDDVTLDLLRRARAWVDRDSRQVRWEITLLDRTTGLPHPNPAAGFLPPEPGGDDAGAGQGWSTISFATDVSASAVVNAQASIVFDTNDPIETNVWTNHLDGTAPNASVTGAATTAVGATVNVSIDDAGGSGAGLVNIYRSVDGGPLRLWQYQVKPGAKVLTGTAGQVIALRARAVDQVGNTGPDSMAFTTTLTTGGGGTGTGPAPGGSTGSSTGDDSVNTVPRADPCRARPFSDVRITDAFCGEISWLTAQGIAQGYADGTFGSTTPVSRAAMAAFLYRLQHPGAVKPSCAAAPFPDVPVGSTFCGEIAWLKSTGIAAGYQDGRFHAERPVSRGAMAAFLYRLQNPAVAVAACTVQPFSDVTRRAEFCAEISWLADRGVTGGYPNGTYRGAVAVSRGAMAAFLYRLSHME